MPIKSIISENQSSHPGSEGASFLGFVMLMRGIDVESLIRRNPKAFILATIIALRARHSPSHRLDSPALELGEALIGDYLEYGMTEQEYRSAKKLLAEHGFATFRATTRGTIAKLCDIRLFNPVPSKSNGRNNGRITDGQRTDNGRITTKEEGKEGKEGKELQESGKSVYPKSALSGGVQGGEQFTDDETGDHFRLTRFPRWLQEQCRNRHGNPDFPDLVSRSDFDKKLNYWWKVVKNIADVKIPINGKTKSARVIFIETCNEQREQIKLAELAKRDPIENRAALFTDRWNSATNEYFKKMMENLRAVESKAAA